MKNSTIVRLRMSKTLFESLADQILAEAKDMSGGVYTEMVKQKKDKKKVEEKKEDDKKDKVEEMETKVAEKVEEVKDKKDHSLDELKKAKEKLEKKIMEMETSHKGDKE